MKVLKNKDSGARLSQEILGYNKGDRESLDQKVNFFSKARSRKPSARFVNSKEGYAGTEE